MSTSTMDTDAAARCAFCGKRLPIVNGELRRGVLPAASSFVMNSAPTMPRKCASGDTAERIARPRAGLFLLTDACSKPLLASPAMAKQVRPYDATPFNRRP